MGRRGFTDNRGWDDGRQATYRMRSKETSEDYRYFPEPDLPPLHVDTAWIERVRAALPELPAARRERYTALGITAYDASVIVADPSMTAAFEAISAAGPALPAKEVANFVTGTHARAVKADGLNAAGTAGSSTPRGIAHLLGAMASGTVSRIDRKWLSLILTASSSCFSRSTSIMSPLSRAGPPGPLMTVPSARTQCSPSAFR